MPDRSKTKPLGHFPSAMAQDQTPLKMPRRKGILRRIAKFSGILILLVAVFVTGTYLFLARGPISNERLRQEIVATLSSMMGPQVSTRILDARISIGKSGLLAVAADNVSLSSNANGLEFGSAGAVHIGLKLLPLLRGNYQVESILVEDAIIDLNRYSPPDANNSLPWPDALHLEKIMQIPAERLYYLAGEMKTAGLEKVTWQNLRIREKTVAGIKPREIVIKQVVIDNFSDTGDIAIKADATIDGRAFEVTGSWKTTKNGHALQLDVDGLDASDMIESAARSEKGMMGLDAPVQISYYHPYDNSLKPQQSTIKLEIGEGLIRFDRNDIAEFSGGQINLRLIPDKNQVELEKSPVNFGATSAVLTGGIRFPLPIGVVVSGAKPSAKRDEKSAEILKNPIFELIANNIIASPSDSPERPVKASFKVTGQIKAEEQILDLDDIRVWSEDGNLQGAGSIGFAGETPSLALALTIPRIKVATLKQLWPLFIATGARRWVMQNTSGGEVVNAEINAAIPPGILGKIRDGKKLAPEYLNIRLDVENVNIVPPGELPVISNASGEVRYSGMETSIQLHSGEILQENGNIVKVTGARMEIGDFIARPTMARLEMSLVGAAPDILRIGSSKPLRVGEVINIKPDEVSGEAKIDLKLSFPLQARFADDYIDWDASIKLSKVDLEKPLEGYKVKSANVLIEASPGIALIKGKALVDGVPTTLSLSEPFGDKSKSKAKRSIKLTLDSKARLKLGLDLDGILKGPVLVAFNTDGGSGPQNYSVDLTRAVVTFPWANWVKGKGIKASAKFTMRVDGATTRISKFRLSGNGFGISGKLNLDKKGLLSANLSQLSLNAGDNIQVSAKRTRNGYSVNVRGKSYDARAIINQVINKGRPKSKATKGYPITLKANIDRVLGFGGETLRNVSLQYSERKGQLTQAVLEGLAKGQSKTALSIKTTKGQTATILVSTNAGSALRFLDIYKKMSGGTLSASLLQKGSGPHKGKVILKNFRIAGEPRLKRLLSSKQLAPGQGGREAEVNIPKPSANPDDLKVNIVSADIIKSADALTIKNGILRAGDVGSNFSGDVYDASGNMSLKGTYLPGYGLNRVASKIPIVGLAFGNGTKRGLLGITYRLRGKAKSPKISVNPISIIAPGIFRKVFEFK